MLLLLIQVMIVLLALLVVGGFAVVTYLAFREEHSFEKTDHEH